MSGNNIHLQKGGYFVDVQTKSNEQITNMLNDWYIEIRARHLGNAHKLRLEIDKKIHNIEEDQNLLLYYSLLDFRHQYLMDHLSIGKNSFDKIESFHTPTDNLLSYYYFFFKAIHATSIGNYNLAKKYYDKAEIKLKEIPDQLEHAEFYYKLSTFSCHNQQYVPAIKQASKAKEIFSKYKGYELNIGYCNNLSGLSCTHLKEYELAEEYFISAMDIFQKEKEKQAILYVRHNLGFMYANQNLSELAIRYLSEINSKSTNNYRAILIEACEHAKLNNNNKALELLEKGLKISNELKIEEYQHRFKILLAINNEIPGEKLESIILAGMIYFEKENLYEYIHEYNEILAIKFHHENNYSKASKYFYLSSKARKKSHNKGALK